MKRKKLLQPIKVGQIWVNKVTSSLYEVKKIRSNKRIVDVMSLKTGSKDTFFKETFYNLFRPATKAEQVLFGSKQS